MNQTLPSHDNGLNHENATFRNCRPEGSSNICYDPSQFCSEIPNNFNPVIIRDDPQQYFSTWKSIGSQSTTDWVANQGPNFVGEGPGPSLKIINSSNIPTPLIDNQSSEIYHNTLQELVTSSNVVRSFVQHPSDLISELDYNPTAKDNSNTQALSLSLSSLPSPNLGNARQDVMGTQGLIHRNPGPLGPFTGYATILRSSKFLRPAQVLLDELCCGSRCKNVEICRLSDQILEEVRVCGDSSGSLFGFNGLNDRSGANGGSGCWVDSYHQPVENLQKKAKLLYMQDEVCKRYKQYHQQMQIVVSSFESVAGLSAATPYVSLALKTVSKHFRCLKNAITDQLKSIRNALGEELLTSPNSAGTSTNKGDANVSMLKFFDQSFQKQKGSASLGINLDSQHVWRPQRGLPERAVSILRAWLFDHFLHPYPTDTDKHMLATQTGLTRNQVSNWFINARVRVWKPMVEEIHMLETKGVAAADQTRTLDPPITANCDDKSNNITQSSNNRLRMITATPDNQVECSNATPSDQPEPDRFNPNAWNHEKRSRIEYHVPSSSVIDGPLMGFVPRPSHGMAGLGAVSLTLGLRQSAENGQRTSTFQPQEHHRRLRPHFGGQMIRGFVG